MLSSLPGDSLIRPLSQGASRPTGPLWVSPPLTDAPPGRAQVPHDLLFLGFFHDMAVLEKGPPGSQVRYVPARNGKAFVETHAHSSRAAAASASAARAGSGGVATGPGGAPTRAKPQKMSTRRRHGLRVRRRS